MDGRIRGVRVVAATADGRRTLAEFSLYPDGRAVATSGGAEILRSLHAGIGLTGAKALVSRGLGRKYGV